MLSLDLRWQGWSDVHIAAAAGDVSKLRHLILKGEDVDKQIPKTLQTALHIAAEKGLEHLIGELLDRLAKSYVSDVEARTPLHLAALHGRTKAAQMLLGPRNRDLEKLKALTHYDSAGCTPLHYAVEHGRLELADALIKAGAPLKGGTRAFGTQAIHLAAASGNLHMLSLVGLAGGSLEERAEDGRLPMHFAAHAGHLQAVQWLLQSGAPPHARDQAGRTARDVASARGQAHIVALIDTLAGPPPPPPPPPPAAPQPSQHHGPGPGPHQHQQDAGSARSSTGGCIWDAVAAAVQLQEHQHHQRSPRERSTPGSEPEGPMVAGQPYLPINVPRLP